MTATLHYAGDSFVLEDDAVPSLIKSIAAKASNGNWGWVDFTDHRGREHWVLIVPGATAHIENTPERGAQTTPSQLDMG